MYIYACMYLYVYIGVYDIFPLVHDNRTEVLAALTYTVRMAIYGTWYVCDVFSVHPFD